MRYDVVEGKSLVAGDLLVRRLTWLSASDDRRARSAIEVVVSMRYRGDKEDRRADFGRTLYQRLLLRRPESEGSVISCFVLEDLEETAGCDGSDYEISGRETQGLCVDMRCVHLSLRVREVIDDA